MSDSQRFANDYQNQDQFSPVLIYVALLPIRFKAAATFFYGFSGKFCRMTPAIITRVIARYVRVRRFS